MSGLMLDPVPGAAASSPFQSLTTTGTSGASTLVAGVLNVPNYAGGGSSAVAIVTESTTTRTAILTDANSLIDCTNNSGCAITIPPQSSVAWGAGAIIYAQQSGTLQVTFAAGAGVTFDADVDSNNTRAKGSIIAMQRKASDVWTSVGDVGFTAPTPNFVSLTTTGTSGAASLAGGVLNVPNYSAGAGGARTRLAQVVCAGSQSVVSFTGIVGTYSDLVISCLTRQTGATAPQIVQIKFNADGTAANYVSHRLFSDGVGTAAGGTDVASTAAGAACFYSSGSASATHPSAAAIITIPGYAQTVIEKSFLCQGGVTFNTSNGVSSGQIAGGWFSSLAIIRIDLTLAGGATFLNGSIFTLYGDG